jgi:hypothetical protein
MAARGVYRMIDDWVMVEFGNIASTMSKWRYEESGIQPPFSQLPLLQEHSQASRTPKPSRDDGAAA